MSYINYSFYSRVRRASLATALLLFIPFELSAEPSGRGLSPDDYGPSLPIWLSLLVSIIILSFCIAGPDPKKEGDSVKKHRVLIIIRRFFRGFNKIVVFLLSLIINLLSSIADLFKPSDNSQHINQVERICSSILHTEHYPSKESYKIYNYFEDPRISSSFRRLNISKEEWEGVSLKLNNIGNIVRITDKLRQAEDSLPHEEIKAKRVALLEKLQGRFGNPLAYSEFQSALQLFGIPEEEWIEDGHRVVFIHHLLDDSKLENFSTKTGIDISKIINQQYPPYIGGS